MKFVSRRRTNFRKENAIDILFSEEKVDGIYNSQNDQIWAVNRAAADTKGRIR